MYVCTICTEFLILFAHAGAGVYFLIERSFQFAVDIL